MKVERAEVEVVIRLFESNLTIFGAPRVKPDKVVRKRWYVSPTDPIQVRDAIIEFVNTNIPFLVDIKDERNDVLEALARLEQMDVEG